MTSKNLVSGLAALALLALASCSAEPSDWRPDKKVSVDVVAPGTRESYDFNVVPQAHSEHNGAAIPDPGVSTQMEDIPQTFDAAKGHPDKYDADHVISENADEMNIRKSEEAAKPGEALPGTHETLKEE